MTTFAAAIAGAGLALAGTAAAAPLDCVVDPARSVKVGSPVTGFLAEVLVERGQVVVAGQPLARLESAVQKASVEVDRLKAESTAELDAQAARVELARARLDRGTELLRRQATSRDSFEELRADLKVAEQDYLRETMERQQAGLELQRSEAALAQRRIRSPTAGVVVERALSPGKFLNEDGHVVTLATLDPLYVEVFLPTGLYAQLSLGMSAVVRPAEPIGGEHSAVVTVIDRVFDAASGTFGVRLVLPNPGNRLPGGQRCTVEFPLPAG